MAIFAYFDQYFIIFFLQEIRFIKKIGNYDEGNLIIENDKIAKPPGGC